jgi:hypothetical protein
MTESEPGVCIFKDIIKGESQMSNPLWKKDIWIGWVFNSLSVTNYFCDLENEKVS